MRFELLRLGLLINRWTSMLRVLVGILFGVSLSAKPAFGQLVADPAEFRIDIESGLYIGPQPYMLNSETALAGRGPDLQVTRPYLALAVSRRIAGLRAYWGLRLDGTLPYQYERRDEALLSDENANALNAAALLTYKAFLFDMEGDCDCPRWGRDSWFKRASFVEFGAGYGLQHYSSIGEGDPDLLHGFAYLARFGWSHRFSRKLDAWLALGLHGFIGPELEESGRHEVSYRPAIGINYRFR